MLVARKAEQQEGLDTMEHGTDSTAHRRSRAPTHRPRRRSLRTTLVWPLATFALLGGLTAAVESPAGAASSITTGQCHQAAYSHPIGAAANGPVSLDGVHQEGTVVVQLMWCRAMQSHFARVTYWASRGGQSYTGGACAVEAEYTNDAVYGCASYLFSGQSQDTQLIYSPTGRWHACWYPYYGNYVCTDWY